MVETSHSYHTTCGKYKNILWYILEGMGSCVDKGLASRLWFIFAFIAPRHKEKALHVLARVQLNPKKFKLKT